MIFVRNSKENTQAMQSHTQAHKHDSRFCLVFLYPLHIFFLFLQQKTFKNVRILPEYCSKECVLNGISSSLVRWISKLGTHYLLHPHWWAAAVCACVTMMRTWIDCEWMGNWKEHNWIGSIEQKRQQPMRLWCLCRSAIWRWLPTMWMMAMAHPVEVTMTRARAWRAHNHGLSFGYCSYHPPGVESSLSLRSLFASIVRTQRILSFCYLAREDNGRRQCEMTWKDGCDLADK